MKSPSKIGRAVIITCVFVMFMISVGAFMLEMNVPASNSYYSDQPTLYKETSSYSSSQKVFAIVKGSIYETGSNMTVFGACQDANGYLLPTSTASFTAWYPNGSVMLGPNGSMLQVMDGANATGRYRIHVTMPNTVGTYFTEMRCEYSGDYALANGEWQNPEWVVRIAQINSDVSNVSSSIQNMSSTMNSQYASTQQNLSTIMSQLQNINSTGATVDSAQVGDVYRAVLKSTGNIWMVDGSNPSYSIGSGINEWKVVDVAVGSNVCMGGSKGEWQCKRDTNWRYGVVSGASWKGISLSHDMDYFILAGSNDTTGEIGVVSFNGGQAFTIPGFSTNDSQYNDVKIANVPFDPAQSMRIFVLGSRRIYSTDDLGTTWQSNGCTNAGDSEPCNTELMSTKMSEVKYNGGQNFVFAYVDNLGNFNYYNGTGVVTTNVIANGFGRGVVLLNATHGYAVFTNATGNHFVYEFNNNVFTKRFEWVGPTSLPTGIAASSENDIWISTTNPGMLYHYNGIEWNYQAILGSYSQGVSVSLDFDNPYNLTTLTMSSISMNGEYKGYVVGSDGVVIKYVSAMDKGLEDLLLKFASVNFTANLQLNLTEVIGLVNNTQNQMNVSFIEVNNKLDQMNNSLYLIQNSTTYIQLYMNNTIEPLLGQILLKLGVVEQTVNRTEAKVDILVNQSMRPRVWTTQ